MEDATLVVAFVEVDGAEDFARRWDKALTDDVLRYVAGALGPLGAEPGMTAFAR